MPKVFISYSRADQAFVLREIVPTLNECGVEYWMDTSGIRSSERWQSKICEALDECDWFLVVMSPRAVASKWVRGEVDWAMGEREDRIAPMLLETCNRRNLHLLLPGIHYADFRKSAEEGKAALKEVCAKMKAAGPTGNASSPPSVTGQPRARATEPEVIFRDALRPLSQPPRADTPAPSGVPSPSAKADESRPTAAEKPVRIDSASASRPQSMPHPARMVPFYTEYDPSMVVAVPLWAIVPLIPKDLRSSGLRAPVGALYFKVNEFAGGRFRHHISLKALREKIPTLFRTGCPALSAILEIQLPLDKAMDAQDFAQGKHQRPDGNSGSETKFG